MDLNINQKENYEMQRMFTLSLKFMFQSYCVKKKFMEASDCGLTDC
jgi:hypothetical protein